MIFYDICTHSDLFTVQILFKVLKDKMKYACSEAKLKIIFNHRYLMALTLNNNMARQRVDERHSLIACHSIAKLSFGY